VPVDLIELPRLKLSFTCKKDNDDLLRLYSVDHDLYISNERSAFTSKLLKGMSHSLLLTNIRGESHVKNYKNCFVFIILY
jgi:hypothetical protein